LTGSRAIANGSFGIIRSIDAAGCCYLLCSEFRLTVL
jgi:hypothetical protein